MDLATNFGGGILWLLAMLALWALPIVLLVWFIKTLTAMSVSLRDIADRLQSIERAIRAAGSRDS